MDYFRDFFKVRFTENPAVRRLILQRYERRYLSFPVRICNCRLLLITPVSSRPVTPGLHCTEKKELNYLDDLFVQFRTDVTLYHWVRLFTSLHVKGLQELRFTHAYICTDKVGMVTVFFRPYPISLPLSQKARICHQTACKNIFRPLPSSTSTSVVSCLSCILAGKVGNCVLHCSDDRSNYGSLKETFPQSDVCVFLEEETHESIIPHVPYLLIFKSTVKPRFTNLIRSWRSFVNRNYFPHGN